MSIVKAKCKNCGCEAPSQDFKLHFELRQMVCPNCFSGKKKKLEEIREKPKQPPGWDAEDVYLEKVRNQRKEETQDKIQRIPGTDQVKYSCKNCTFTFKYNPFTKRPGNCPYCNGEIPRIKTFNII